MKMLRFTGLRSKDTADLSSGVAGDGLRLMLKTAFLLALIAMVAFEGYYIATLRARIERQTEELENISVQLQALRHERANLSEELSSLKESGGENKDGNSLQR